MNHIVFCFKHPEYRGLTKPNLKCKTCCSIYLDMIRKEEEKLEQEESMVWVDRKIAELSRP